MTRLRGVIKRFKTGDYTVRRYGPGSFTNGIHTPGTLVSTFLIEACIQPVTGEDVDSSVEAEFGKEVQLLFTETELKVRNAVGDSDVIFYKDASWIVVRTENWDAFGGNHWRSLIARLNIS